MASFNEDFGTQLMTCPYNNSHRVKSSKYQIHITQCAKTCVKHQLKVCPFNANHRIDEVHFARHLIQCEDNLQFVKQITDNNSPHLKQPKIENEFAIIDKKWKNEDIWSDEYKKDDEINCSTFQANQLLCKQQLTAQQLFNFYYGSNQAKNIFTDNLYLSRMSSQERRKYNNLVVNKMKEKQVKANIDNEDIGIDWKPKIDKVVINDNQRNECSVLRRPALVPFSKKDGLKNMGIGRGVLTKK